MKEAKNENDSLTNEDNKQSLAFEIFNRAMTTFSQYHKLFEMGFFLPEDLVADLLFVANSGSGEIKITSLKILACFAFRDQIKSIDATKSVVFSKQAADLGDKESAIIFRRMSKILFDSEPVETCSLKTSLNT